MTVKMLPSLSSRQLIASGVMTPFRRVILSLRLMSVSYAPDDLDGDMLALVHLGSRAMFCVGWSDDRSDRIDTVSAELTC